MVVVSPSPTGSVTTVARPEWGPKSGASVEISPRSSRRLAKRGVWATIFVDSTIVEMVLRGRSREGGGSFGDGRCAFLDDNDA
eukprot:8215668-Lingulodinium_polyedra.AAC.1